MSKKGKQPTSRLTQPKIVGDKLATHHPVIEPVSEIRVRNGIFRCRDGGSKSAFFSCRDRRGDESELEKARYSRDKCTDHPWSSIPGEWLGGGVGGKLGAPPPTTETGSL